jgi:trk system potassium uptake protein TrkA
VLEAAGIADADILVALTSSDEVNMMACEVAYTLYRTPTKIARIRSSEYTKHPKLFSDEALSVDVWISPEQLVTEYIERLIRYPGALQVLDFADGRVRLVGLRARKGGRSSARRCARCASTFRNRSARGAIYRAGAALSPEGDTVIEDGDEVFFLAAREGHPQVMNEMRKEESPVRAS